MNLAYKKPVPVTSRLPLKHDLNKQPESLFNREKVQGITIDGAYSEDLDDAINVISLGDGRFKFQVHIADLSEVVIPNSVMDEYAISRVCTAYMDEYISHMLSRNIATNISALNENGTKHTITYECVLDRFGNISEEDIFRSSFDSIKQCNYRTFHYLKNTYPDFINSINEVSSIVTRILGNRHEQDRGIIDFRGKAKAQPVGPRYIIEKFMLFTNLRVALFLRNNYNTGIYRNQLNVGEKAKYENEMTGHASLDCIGFTHFTSPIRRYIDIVVHRILLGIGNYQHNEIGEICEYINRRIIEIRKELKMKEFNDNIIRGRRKVKRVKKGEDEINFKYMNDRQFKFNIIYLSRVEYCDKIFKDQFLDELERRFSLREKRLDRKLLIYLFLVGDKDFKERIHKILVNDSMINDTSLGNIISVFFEVDEIKEIDENDFEYRRWSLRFKGKDGILYEKKVCIDNTTGINNKLPQKRKKFITEAVLNGGISLKMKYAMQILN